MIFFLNLDHKPPSKFNCFFFFLKRCAYNCDFMVIKAAMIKAKYFKGFLLIVFQNTSVIVNNIYSCSNVVFCSIHIEFFT